MFGMIRERDLATVNISKLKMAFIYEAMFLISVCRSSSYLSIPNRQPVEHERDTDDNTNSTILNNNKITPGTCSNLDRTIIFVG